MVMNHTVTFAESVGAGGDKTVAVVRMRPTSISASRTIILVCRATILATVKVCVDFYDDPAFAGLNVTFGPEAYATDDKGGVGFYPEANRQLLEGSGQWIRRSCGVAAVNLKGVNADAYTAGPRFISVNGQVAVSRGRVGRDASRQPPLAGQDPLAACYEDPTICTDKYGNFVELDLGKEIRNGLDVGSSSGDQEMIVAEAGPVNDRRQAVPCAR